MPLDALGCTRTTLAGSERRTPERDCQARVPVVPGIGACNGPVNQERLVSACHHRALAASLPLVHTARRSYRLGALASSSDCFGRKSREPQRLKEGEVVTRYP